MCKGAALRGTTLVEVMIGVAILALLTAGFYGLMSSGARTYHQEAGYISAQQQGRRAMEAMTKELRGASRGNFSNTGTFPNNITFSTLDTAGIEFYVNYTENQLVRQVGANTTVLGNYITEATFDRSGDLVTVSFSIDKPVSAVTGNRNLTGTLQEKVRLRND